MCGSDICLSVHNYFHLCMEQIVTSNDIISIWYNLSLYQNYWKNIVNTPFISLCEVVTKFLDMWQSLNHSYVTNYYSNIFSYVKYLCLDFQINNVLIISDSSVRHNVVRQRRSLLLDPCHSGVQQRNPYGAGYLPHRDLWFDHAAAGRRQDHWSRRHPQGPSALQRCTEM